MELEAKVKGFRDICEGSFNISLKKNMSLLSKSYISNVVTKINASEEISLSTIYKQMRFNLN